MSSLEEKLKRISGELSAYRPMEEAPAPRASACLHEVREWELDEAAGGLLGYADHRALSVVCREGADAFVDWDISRAAFVDTETTGLMGGAGTVAFLIGLGYVAEGRFVVEQFFMQDYDVEQEMLSRLCRRLDDFDYLVSFNGKCFDGPLIASRAVINRVRQPLDDMVQVDLLHAARRIYKRRLKRCNLQTLEREVLGHTREGDIDGALVPVLFFEYLRSGDFGPMELVMEHNRQDIVSLLTLLCRLCWAVSAPEELGFAQDIHSCGRLQERMGNLAEAERCYRLAAQEGGEALRELSMLLKRTGRVEEAAALWRRMAGEGGFGLLPHEELAKYCEHVTGDIDGALAEVDAALTWLRGASGTRPAQALLRRRERLLHKRERGTR